MRPKFLVGVIVGLLLVYLSIFGLSGFGLALTGTPENFTTYTEVDPGGYVTVTASRLTVTNMPRTATAYVYKDFGVDYFGDFEMQIESLITSQDANAALYILSLANQAGPSNAMSNNLGLSTGQNNILWGVWPTFDKWQPSQLVGTTYYFHLQRTGAIAICQVYSDSSYSILLHTLTATVSTKFRYVIPCQSAGSTESDVISGWTQNLRIAGSTPPPTYSDVTISVSGQGTTIPAAGHYTTTYLVNDSLTVVASPASGWVFDYVTRNGVTVPSLTLTSLGASEQIIVYFKTAPIYSDVTVSTTGQGTTTPVAGHYATTYYVGDSLTIVATPASGWVFDYMTRNGVTVASMTLNALSASEQVVVYFKTGPATTGTLRIFASYNGAYVVAPVTASGSQTVYGATTTDPANPLSFTVTAGTYTVSGTYSSGSASPISVTVPAGGSADASLNFGGTPPPNDFLEMIMKFLNALPGMLSSLFNLLAFRSLLLVIGLALSGGCGIGFMLPEKEQHY